MRLGRAQRFKPLILKQRVLGSDVTVTLSGVSAVANAGTLGLGFEVALSGVSSATALGALNISQDLAGVSGTAAVGNLSTAIEIALAGVSAGVETGTISGDSGSLVALTGVSSTVGLGVLSPLFDLALTGVNGTGVIGSLSPSGGSVSLELSGVSATAFLGSLSLVTPGGQPSVAGAGYPVDWQGKRRKLRLKERPRAHLDAILERVVADYRAAGASPKVISQAKKKAREALRELEVEETVTNDAPMPQRLLETDWVAINAASDEVRGIMARARQARVRKDDDEILMLFG